MSSVRIFPNVKCENISVQEIIFPDGSTQNTNLLNSNNFWEGTNAYQEITTLNNHLELVETPFVPIPHIAFYDNSIMSSAVTLSTSIVLADQTISNQYACYIFDVGGITLTLANGQPGDNICVINNTAADCIIRVSSGNLYSTDGLAAGGQLAIVPYIGTRLLCSGTNWYIQ